MASMTETKYSTEIKEFLELSNASYDQFLMVKDAYVSRNKEKGYALLSTYKKYGDTELFTLYVLYGAFNKMMSDSHMMRMEYIQMQIPEYFREMVMDMKSLNYPILHVIRDVDKHHAPNFPFPFSRDQDLQVR